MHLRENLVMVRAGDQSLHSRWLDDSKARNWDLFVSYFGVSPDRVGTPEYFQSGTGPKWPTLKKCVEEWREPISRYRYVIFPDDDLDCTQDQWNLFFEICKERNLALAQPSLSYESYVSHTVTLNNPQFVLRYTDWVELMAPCFRQDALQQLAATFDENISGWGIDTLWPRFLGADASIAVVDAVQVRHTRPFGGPNYDHSRKAGTTAYDEAIALFQRHGIVPGYIRYRGAITADGKVVSEGDLKQHADSLLVKPW